MLYRREEITHIYKKKECFCLLYFLFDLKYTKKKTKIEIFNFFFDNLKKDNLTFKNK